MTTVPSLVGPGFHAPSSRPKMLSLLSVCLSVTHVEELDGGPTPFQCFAVHHWGQRDFTFFGQKIGTVQRSGLPLGSIIGETPAHSHNFFFRQGNSCNSRKKSFFVRIFEFFSGEIGQGTFTKISPYNPWGPHITQSKFRPCPLPILRNRGKTLGGGGPRAPRGRRVGFYPKLKMPSTRGPPCI